MMPFRSAFLLAWLAVASGALAGLPDTGQTGCYNTAAVTDCTTDAGFPRQDGSLGSTPGYTKLDAAGQALDPAATAWSCVRDDATGLVWEAKTRDGGIHDTAHRYTWFNSFDALNGGDRGTLGTAESCAGSLGWNTCNTEFMMAVANSGRLCGADDWRVPTQRELLTLVHAGRGSPAIDATFFPNTAHGVYWSTDTYAAIPAFAWGVHFGYGAANATQKDRLYHLRLVRGKRF